MQINGLREIADQFDGMLIDQFGVIHDGQELYRGTLCILSELHDLGIPVAVMTNSGKRAAANRQRLVKMGVPREHFTDCISSGEVAYRTLLPSSHVPSFCFPSPLWGGAGVGVRESHNQPPPTPTPPHKGEGLHGGEALKVFLIGRDGEDYGFSGITFVDDPRAADIILILGSNAPDTSLEDYRKLLTGLSLPAICCNPDKLMLTPHGLLPAPGAIAALYEEMGSKVSWIGKPYPEIYHHAAKLIGNPKRILCIGDSAEHDVAGGRNAGHATLLVMTGVSEGRDVTALQPQPDFWMKSFTW